MIQIFCKPTFFLAIFIKISASETPFFYETLMNFINLKGETSLLLHFFEFQYHNEGSDQGECF